MAFLSAVFSCFGSPPRVSCDDGQKKEAKPKHKPRPKHPIPVSHFPHKTKEGNEEEEEKRKKKGERKRKRNALKTQKIADFSKLDSKSAKSDLVGGYSSIRATPKSVLESWEHEGSGISSCEDPLAVLLPIAF
ncbi:hypothetical protein AAC387_Pa08g1054 [Persea americana]